jgi:hypothetical protein
MVVNYLLSLMAFIGLMPIIGSSTGQLNASPQTSAVFLPLTLKNRCSPTIEFTSVPAYGSFQDLLGQVTCATPADYKVAVYIKGPSSLNIFEPIYLEARW